MHSRNQEEDGTELSVFIPKQINEDKLLHRKTVAQNNNVKNRETESHHYEQNESEVWWHHQLQR